MASRPSRWFPALRALLTLGRHLGQLVAHTHEIAQALTRIADALDTLRPDAPPQVLPDPPPDFDHPYDLAYRDDREIARAVEIEAQLGSVLGRQPTPDEVVRVLDGVEWTEGDAEDHRRKVEGLITRTFGPLH